MIWFNSDSTEEQIISMLKQNFGLIKRNSGEEIVPELPYKRPLTFLETKTLKNYFGNEFRWTDIDSMGRIILIDLKSSETVGNYFITEQDLKDEINK